MKLPALVGYLLAGVAIGPATPGFVADAQIASQLAEVGVMLLMFGVGLHFSIDDLMAVRKIALPGAVVQMVVATALGAGVASLWGWSLGAALVFGISLSVAILITLAQAGGFVAFMLIVGRRLFPWILWQVTKTGSRELFTLCVIAAAVSIAYGSAVRVGKHIAGALGKEGIPYVVAESNREFVELLRAKGIPAVWGNATDPEVLIQAHIKDARALVIATPETVQVRRMVETARTLNPPIRVAVRSHSAEEAERLEKDGTGTVFVAERELAKSMAGFVLSVMASAGSAAR